MAETLSEGKWTPEPYHLLLSAALFLASFGYTKRLIVNMPPRHGKSELCSYWFPLWYLNTFPDRRVMIASYQATIGAGFGRRVRNAVKENAQNLRIRVAGDAASQYAWATNAGGWMYGTGIGGVLTSRGADVALIDDPIKDAKQAQSQTIRQNAWDWYLSTMRSRIEPGGAIVVIQTRWHEDDLAGRLLQASRDGTGEHWDVLSLPAIAEADEAPSLYGLQPFTRRKGEALWPSRWPVEALQELVKGVGGFDSWVWSALYQQRPSMRDGGIFTRAMFGHRYAELPRLTERSPVGSGIMRTIQAIDTSYGEGVGSDFSVIATGGMDLTDVYAIDQWRGQVEFPELRRAVMEQAERHSPDKILVEDTGAGRSLLQALRRDTRLPLAKVAPIGSKISRAESTTPAWAGGKVKLPAEAPWVKQMVAEHLAFPNAAHDDTIDAWAYVIRELLLKGRAKSIDLPANWES